MSNYSTRLIHGFYMVLSLLTRSRLLYDQGGSVVQIEELDIS